MSIKVSDYIIDFLVEKGINDMFGYPGGVICHLMDSAAKRPDDMILHLCYNEQAAALAACGFAQEKCSLGVAYSTSGPGATNLVTGIANAYFDSIPVIFITGQVDTYSLRGSRNIRQLGFQETDVCSMTRCITKYTVMIDHPDRIVEELEKAYYIATQGNPGPVLIDIPADVQRAEIDINKIRKKEKRIASGEAGKQADIILKLLSKAKRPCILLGNGVKQSGCKKEIREIVRKIHVPVVCSMPAFDTLAYYDSQNFGFIGANGHRYANFIISKSDLIITLGSRLDLKQIGMNREKFAPDTKIVRIDIDCGNFDLKINATDYEINLDLRKLLPEINQKTDNWSEYYKQWNHVCYNIKEKLKHYDDEVYSTIIYQVCKSIPDNCTITCDVGQSEVWIAQQFEVKDNQSVHMSAGHGTMGYSLPAAIGAYYANPRMVVSFNGDGGIMMNLQELQLLARERIPVKVVVINNYALGMIRGFQEANFDKRYVHTTEDGGYLSPNFSKIAEAFNMKYYKIERNDDIESKIWEDDSPALIEISIRCDTHLIPNFGQNGRIQDARPYLERQLYDELMEM